MELIIGGAFQGKKAYAAEHCCVSAKDIVDGAEASYEDIFSCRCLCHFHEWIGARLREDRELKGLELEIVNRNPGLVLISNELGYGVVPVDSFDRRYREETGRVCTRIAAKAQRVVRVTCGIGMVIKDD